MKKIRLVLLVLLVGLGMSCQGLFEPKDDYITSIPKARRQLVGQWKLTRVFTMMPKPDVPSVELRISKGQIAVIEDNKVINAASYNLDKEESSIQLKLASPLRIETYSVQNPTVRLNSQRLLMDDGMALDGPGFEFERIK